MNAFVVFVSAVLFLWGASMWALHWGFKRQAQRDRALGLDAAPAPSVDAEHAQFWQARSNATPASAASVVRVRMRG